MSIRHIVSIVFVVTLVGVAQAGLQAQEAQAPAPAPTTKAQATPINLNTATLAQLESLPGIGAKVAARIKDYREKTGGFKKTEELMNVRGIGEKAFLRIRPLVTVTPAKPEPGSAAAKPQEAA